MTVKERLKKFIDFNGLSVREFERICQLSNGTVNSLKDNISTKIRNIILEKFPTLNLLWLMTGKGEMLQGSVSINTSIRGNEFNDIDMVSEVSADYEKEYDLDELSFEDWKVDDKLNEIYKFSLGKMSMMGNEVKFINKKVDTIRDQTNKIDLLELEIKELKATISKMFEFMKEKVH